jgi:ABC-type multidrug transport system ATPase subunit
LISIGADSITKRFGAHLLFRDLTFSVSPEEAFYITGENGSGKSTLLQILAGLQKPYSGHVVWEKNNVTINPEIYLKYSGFTGPQVNPYDMLTAQENIEFVTDTGMDADKISSLLNLFGIYKERNRLVKHYSSGMKQRLKIINAIINDPPVIFLDEPGSNLDAKGKDILYSTIEKIKPGKTIIIATNEPDEIRLCTKGIVLDDRNL